MFVEVNARIARLVVLPVTLALAACSSSQNDSTSGSTGSNSSSQNGSAGTGQGGSSGTFSTGAFSTGTSLSSGTGAGGGGCGAPTVCQTDADCDDGDPSTIDTCVTSQSGEFTTKQCVHVQCTGDGCSGGAVDPTCTPANTTIVYPPFVALVPPDVPTSCSNGFQICDAEGAMPYVLKSISPAGSQGLTLDLDIATYTAPDGVVITGVDACGTYVLFDTCHLRTADNSETSYTNGMARPQDIALRQFHLDLHPGTTQLTVDFSRVVSPMYVQVLGLCDFTIPVAAGVGWFAMVP